MLIWLGRETEYYESKMSAVCETDFDKGLI